MAASGTLYMMCCGIGETKTNKYNTYIQSAIHFATDQTSIDDMGVLQVPSVVSLVGTAVE